MRAVTGAPIKLAGMGEKIDAAGPEFNPERIAGRILGMGDIVGLVEKAGEPISTRPRLKSLPSEDGEGQVRFGGLCLSN